MSLTIATARASAAAALVVVAFCRIAAASELIDDDLGPAPDAALVKYVAMSADCHHVAVAVVADKGAELCVDGKPVATANAIPFVVYSPDGAHLFYTAQRGTAWAAVLDGRGIWTGSAAPVQAHFSPDGQHVVFVDSSNGHKTAVLDGVAEKSSFDDIQYLTVDGDHPAHVAYAACSAKDKWTAILDGKPVGKVYRAIDGLSLSSVLQRLAFVGCLNPDRGVAERYEVVVDGEAYGPYFAVTAPPVFSPHDQIMWGACRPTGPLEWGMFPLDFFGVRDGVVEDRKMEQATRIFFCGADRSHFAYLGAPMLGPFGDPGVGYDRLMLRQPMPGNFLVIDGKEMNTSISAGGMSNFTLAPDGRNYAFDQQLMVDFITSGWAMCVSKGGKELEESGYYRAGPPLFSPKGLSVGYAAQRNPDPKGNPGATGQPWFMVVGKGATCIEGPSGLVYPSVDSAGDGQWRPNDPSFGNSAQTSIDNGYSYDGQIPYHFDPDGTLVYFRIADGHLYRLHWKPDDATTLPSIRP